MLSVSRVARELGVNRYTVAKGIREGNIKGVKVGRWVMVPESEIERMKSPLRKTGDKKVA